MLKFLTVAGIAALTFTQSATFAADASPAYAKTVMTKVMGSVDYPRMAKVRHQEGQVVVALDVGADGKVAASKIEKSSGTQSLDDAALAAVQAAAPYPAPAEGTVTIHGAINFKVDG